MKEYECKPPHNTMKRWKQAKKNYLKWFDTSKDSLGYCKNITRNVMTMNRIYSTKDTLFN